MVHGNAATSGPATSLPPQWDARTWTSDAAAWATSSLIAQSSPRPNEPFGVYVLNGLDTRSFLGRMVEHERFAEEFGNDTSYLFKLYGAFEATGATELIVVVDHEQQRPAGVIRLIQNSTGDGCPTLNDLQADGPNGWGLAQDEIERRSSFDAAEPGAILDIATIAVAKQYASSVAGHTVSEALYSALMQRSLQRRELETWVCAMARIPYGLVQAYSGDVMEEFDGVAAQPYHGDADTVPVWSNFRQYERRLRDSSPELHRRLSSGEGLADYYFRLDPNY